MKKLHIRLIRSVLLLGLFMILIPLVSSLDFQHDLISTDTTSPRLLPDSSLISEKISYQNDDNKGSISPKEGTHFTTWGEISESSGLHTLRKETIKTNTSADSKIKVDDGKIELVIGFNPTVSINENAYENIQFSSKIEKTIEKLNALVVSVPITSLEQLFDQWLSLEEVRYIEPNQIYSIELVPDDPNWSTQWAPQKIQADLAWDIQMGDPSIVLVAVIDTGIDYTHPDLSAQYVPLGYDWVNNDSDPMDDHSHGTHCAGIIAASINNAMGIAGVANVQIMAEKFLDDSGTGSDYDAADAIIHAVDQGADILSNSWGGSSPSTILKDALTYATANDVVIIAAAGNAGSSTLSYPAAYPEAISVSATDKSDDLAFFSNYGSTLEISAPGVDIYSTIPVTMGSYDSKSGTSMACPHVSGVAALILSEFPSWSAEQIREHLRDKGDDLGELGWDQYYGYGRLNAYKAVQPPFKHNLKIYLDSPSVLKPGSSASFNISVYNAGQENETNVYAKFWINGSLVKSIVFPKISSKTYASFSYNWTAIDESYYNLTAFVRPVINETLIFDNHVSKQLIVLNNIIGFISTYGESSLSKVRNYYENLGYFIDVINSPITTPLLENYPFIFVGEGGATWSESEITAAQDYIQNGGVLIAIGDRFHMSGAGQVAAAYGISFIKSVATDSGSTTVFDSFHHLMEGITSIYLESVLYSLEVNGSVHPIIWDETGSRIYGAAVDDGFGHMLVLADDFDLAINKEDNKKIFDNILSWPSRQSSVHDISVHLEAPILLSPNEKTVFNVTVKNLGSNDERNVELQVWINNFLETNTEYSIIPAGASETLSLPWMPTVEGTYNITVYSVPVINETWISNNFDIASIKVKSESQVILFDEAHNPSYSIGSNPAFGAIGGYSEFADMLLDMGHFVETINPGTVIDSSVLDGANVLVIVASQNAYTTAELDAIEFWVENGGSLLLISDWEQFGTQMDILAARFVFDFANNKLNDSDDSVMAGYDFRISYDDTNLLSHP
ncbi:MAG: S8 family serine peptidase, partial [Candidatus Heimdallarchaeota archaeon]